MYLGHHAPPSDDIRLYSFPCLLLMSCNSLQQAVKMIIGSIIKLLERVKAF
jgi:hypothetical protein